jgi:hypothetical protein
MVIDEQKIDALAAQLAPRWEGILSQSEICIILRTERYQDLYERAINLYGLSEIEAWHKALNANVVLSR